MSELINRVLKLVFYLAVFGALFGASWVWAFCSVCGLVVWQVVRCLVGTGSIAE